MSAKNMTCMTCGRTKAYPDGFPNATYAECWQCAWSSHIHQQHPRIVRGIRRAAKKRARRLAERDIREAMFGSELDQAIGPAAAREHRDGIAQPAPHLSTDRRRPLCDDHVESSAEGVA